MMESKTCSELGELLRRAQRSKVRELYVVELTGTHLGQLCGETKTKILNHPEEGERRGGMSDNDSAGGGELLSSGAMASERGEKEGGQLRSGSLKIWLHRVIL